MEPNIYINNIQFKNGIKIELFKNSIVVFVGPNNAGKSKTLKEIYRSTQSKGSINNLIVDNVDFTFEGESSELLNKLESRRLGDNYFAQGAPGSIHGSSLIQSWNRAIVGDTLDFHYNLLRFFVKEMDTAQRLSLVNQAGNIDFMTHQKTHPIHILKEQTEKELEFSKYFRMAFGEDVIVNHGAGSVIPLHVGKRPEVTAENDRVSTHYQQILRALPKLHDQGDGMKSFAGVFLSLFAEDFSINIIDEPEAFLHPPQAALLGQMIAKKLGENKQLIIATHSEHILKGLLDSAADRLIIIRIQRDGANNKINVLENSELQTIWSDSLLRHSNILDGLFHKRVILCESDSDCRFYSAIANAVTENDKLLSPDILYLQSGGKHRFPIVIKALKTLEVPITVIGDFDFYHDENPTRSIYELYGGNWDEIKTDFLKVKKSIDEKRPELETSDLKTEIDDLFTTFNDKIIPESKLKVIQALLKKASPWSQAKSSGQAYLPAGEPTNAFKRIQKKLKEKGIYVLEIGEIEAFDKTIGGHGPKWVNHVLEKDLINSADLETARKFVKETILD